mmetsp:Transcript_76283/g.221422  ORF Transcript_76283/g.221422 Transcript_76283/m.221422 type:complete len:229 (-) Transcript_76283:57-743(-)
MPDGQGGPRRCGLRKRRRGRCPLRNRRRGKCPGGKCHCNIGLAVGCADTFDSLPLVEVARVPPPELKQAALEPWPVLALGRRLPVQQQPMLVGRACRREKNKLPLLVRYLHIELLDPRRVQLYMVKAVLLWRFSRQANAKDPTILACERIVTQNPFGDLVGEEMRRGITPTHTPLICSLAGVRIDDPMNLAHRGDSQEPRAHESEQQGHHQDRGAVKSLARHHGELLT